MKHFTLAALLASALAFATAASGQFKPPIPEELAMTSQAEVPGAGAVYLYREETTDDHLHMFSIYARIKVLTESGKEYANVELPYTRGSDGGGISIDNIQGRTIHPDGTIIPFTGKPMSKLVDKITERGNTYKLMTKVFTLPDVQIGSVIEYSYQKRLDDHYYSSPDWYVQSDLFTRRAHYQWKPTDAQLTLNESGSKVSQTVAWTPILPAGVQVKQVQLPPVGVGNSGQNIITLDIDNVPPTPREEMMPPMHSFTYRVLFYYAAYRTPDEFWKKEGKEWAKQQDKFIGPGKGVSTAVAQLVSPADTPEAKLHKLYAAVQALENTDLTRSHSTAEEKADGLKQVHTTDDVLARKRGSGDQLNALFVAMARAAGLKASVMVVTNRDRSIFFRSYLTLGQLDDDITIVNVDGKDLFLDPGTRFCPFGQLAWKHSNSAGMRQTDGGTELVGSPAEKYTDSRVQRLADLNLDERGEVTGKVRLIYTGAPAVSWRQQSVTGDAVALKRDLQTTVEHMLPGGMSVEIASIENTEDYEKPLLVVATVSGAIGAPTGKRLLIPADLFEGNTKPLFSHEKRELPVYFDYSRVTQDAIRINLPASLTIESLPAADKQQLTNTALFTMTSEKTPRSVTIRRDYILGTVIFPQAEYSQLRSFYGKMESKDQEPIVLTRATTVSAVTGAPQ